MAKASDYKSIAKGLASQWVKCMLISDTHLKDRIRSALGEAVDKAIELEEKAVQDLFR